MTSLSCLNIQASSPDLWGLKSMVVWIVFLCLYSYFSEHTDIFSWLLRTTTRKDRRKVLGKCIKSNSRYSRKKLEKSLCWPRRKTYSNCCFYNSLRLGWDSIKYLYFPRTCIDVHNKTCKDSTQPKFGGIEQLYLFKNILYPRFRVR